MAAFKNDGTVQYGSVVLTINAVTYVADSFTVSRPGKTIERTDHLDEPSGQVSYAGFITGSATLQLATSLTVIPTQGLTFSSSVSGSAETFYLDSVDQPHDKAGEKKINITFRKQYN